jgi:hypothetical protein
MNGGGGGNHFYNHDVKMDSPSEVEMKKWSEKSSERLR